MENFIADKNKKLSKLALENVEGLSFSSFMKALRKKDVKVNGKRVSSDVLLQVGDRVEIYCQQAPSQKFSTVYKDQNVLVINKKSGYSSESVFDSISEEFIGAGFIHRLDRNTSGLMIFSLNATAEKELLYGFKERNFEKYYTATVIGKMDKKEAVLTAYLIKDEKASRVRITDRQEKGAVTIKTGYKVIQENEETSTLRVTLYTGKTHQIRAHLAHIGHPIVGDGKYGDFAFNEKTKNKTQMLSATELVLHFKKESALSYLDGKKFSL